MKNKNINHKYQEPNYKQINQENCDLLGHSIKPSFLLCGIQNKISTKDYNFTEKTLIYMGKFLLLLAPQDVNREDILRKALVCKQITKKIEISVKL